MDEDSQQTIAVWIFILLSSLIFHGFLYTRDQLTGEIVSLFWFPVVVLTITGVITPPWRPLVSR